MTAKIVKPKGKVRLYCAGGCGINIGNMLEVFRNRKEAGFAEMDIIYIDTSMANIKPTIDRTFCHLISSTDGSGGLRSENHTKINDRIKSILQEFEPADLNIVISSGGGGSGSVTAPLLVRDLLASKQTVIALTVGSTDTILATKNTLNTLKSYDAIAEMTGAPVVMAYIQNALNLPREEADDFAYNTVMSLLILFSRDNHELDSRDLYHWLNFNRVTTFKPQLANLTIASAGEDFKNIGDVISVVSLAKKGEANQFNYRPEYQKTGFIPEELPEKVVAKLPINFIVSDGVIPDVTAELTKILSEHAAHSKARETKSRITLDSDDVSTSGLVL